jgi:hypothetical protein
MELGVSLALADRAQAMESKERSRDDDGAATVGVQNHQPAAKVVPQGLDLLYDGIELRLGRWRYRQMIEDLNHAVSRELPDVDGPRGSRLDSDDILA